MPTNQQKLDAVNLIHTYLFNLQLPPELTELSRTMACDALNDKTDEIIRALNSEKDEFYYIYVTDPSITCLVKFDNASFQRQMLDEENSWRFVNKIAYRTRAEAFDALLKFDLLLNRGFDIQQKIRLLELLDMLPK